MLKDGTTTKSSVGMVFERTFSMMPDLAEYKGVAGYSKTGAQRCGAAETVLFHESLFQ
jgi:hypothetical protein